NLTTGNTVTIKAADDADVPHNITIDGVISGAGGFTKTGGGALILTGANLYSGSPTVSAGTLQGNTASLRGNIANSGNVTFNQPNAGTFTGVVSGTGSLTKTGPGALSFANPQTYTGA